MHLKGRTILAVATLTVVASASGATSFTVASSIANGQTLSGKLRWTATVSGISGADVSTVEFSVDGSRKTTERREPYAYGGDQGLLDTTALANGSHVFGVIATATDGSKASVNATATTKNPPVNASRPSISGTPRDGSTLSGNRGSWTGPGPVTYAYGWLRCDAAGGACGTISGASSSSYKATAADVGHRLRLVVNATNTAGAVAASSDATGPVAARGGAPSPTAEPRISGSARDGALLTTSRGGWANSPTAYAYQ
jgi:hypothetical protein